MNLTGDFDKKMAGSLPDRDRRAAYIKYRKEFYRASNFKERYDYPVHVDIELTNTCNYRCHFCEHGKDPREKKEYYKKAVSLPKYKVFDILDECADMGVKSVQFNIINEPLIYADLIEVIGYAKKLGFPDIFFITNGSLLNRGISGRLIHAGLTKIMFSIDAFSEDTYRAVRNKKAAYGKVVNNILEFLEVKKSSGARLPLTRVCFVITEINRHEAKDFIGFWRTKVDSIIIQDLMDLSGKRFPGKRPAANLKKHRCNRSYFRLSIKADGRVNPCCAFYGDDITLGNVYKDSLADIWGLPRLRDFQAMHKKGQWHKNGVCRKCVASMNISDTL